MDEQVQRIIAGSAEEAQAATASVLEALQQGSLNVLGLVGLLQRPLTDDVDHEGRAKAVQLLAQVAAEAPAALQPGDVGVLAEFLAGKLSDWRCLPAAVPGCTALLQRHRTPSLAPLPAADAAKLVSHFVKVHVQGLDYKGRLACYQLLLELLQGPCAVPVVLGGADLAYFTVVAMENEADPRCLLVALQCVEAVGLLYRRPDLAVVSHLQDNIEDLFDACVAPYFPIMFTAPKNDTHRITRDMLLQRVLAAMACCPEFAPLAIPVLSEKLGSSLKQAKEDSLAALPVCLKSWGPAAVRPHLQPVWLMLKSELMGPSAVDSTQQPEQLPPKQALAAKAAGSLQASVAALGPGLLDRQVLNDVAVEDLLQYLGLVNPPWGSRSGSSTGEGGGPAAAAAAGGGEGTAGQQEQEQEGWHLPLKAQRRLACIASCVAAVAGAGGGCSAAACSEVLSPALAAVLQDTADLADSTSAAAGQQKALRPLQANCSVLCVLHASLKAVAAAAAAAAVADQGATASVGADWAAVAALMPELLVALNRLQALISLFQQQQEGAGQDAGSNGVSGLQISKHADMLQREQLQLWLLLLWQDVLALPPSISQLQPQQLTVAAQQLLQLAIHGSGAEVELELAPGSSASQQAAAAAALTQLAAWTPARPPAAGAGVDDPSDSMLALSSCADPLLQLLQRPVSVATAAAAGSEEGGVFRASAVRLLGQLGSSGPAAAWQVLQWLLPLVLQHVRQCAWEELKTVLHILNNSCLPTLQVDLAASQSVQAAAFCVSLLEACQQQQQQQDANAVLSMCLLAGQLAARCSLADQQQLLLPASAWVAQAAAALATASGSDATGTTEPQQLLGAGPVCVALSMLAAARPGLLTAVSTVDLIRSAASLAVHSSSSSSSSWVDSTVAAVAVASILNKSLGTRNQQQHKDREPGVDASAVGAVGAQPEDLLAAALPVLTQPLQQQQQQQNGSAAGGGAAAAAAALKALAWTARGMAQQRHDLWQELMQQYVLPVLLTSAGQQQQPGNGPIAEAAAVPGEVLWAAAEFFAVLVAPAQPQGAAANSSSSSSSNSSSGVAADVDASALGHGLSLHCFARPLWQQKAFVLALQALQSAAAAAATTDSPPSSQLQQGQAEGGVWLAVGSLLSAAPAALPAAGQEDQLLLLLQCVVHLLRTWESATAASSGAVQACSNGSTSVGQAAATTTKGWVGQARLLQLLHSCLLMLGNALSGGSAGGGQQAAEEAVGLHVQLLLTSLCELARLQSCAAGQQQQQQGGQQMRRQAVQLAASVREVALMCLTSCMAGIPYHLLHPHRRAVLAAVSAALDDDRRAVRKAAVACRAAWSSG